MDVTAEIRQNHLRYGSSDNTAPAGLSSSRSLNYASGGSINKPEQIKIKIIPFTLNYKDSVGLFGSENYFVKVDVEVDPRYTFACFEEEFWECARESNENGTVNTYSVAVIDENEDLTTVNTYEPAEMQSGLQEPDDGYISIDLNNLKTGNIYVDSWLDIRLYTQNREEHPYDKMFIRPNEQFYIGFHARNTRRLPYNVDCMIGNQYVSGSELSADDAKKIARINQQKQ